MDSLGGGRVPVAVSTDTEFNTVEKIGGEKSHSYTPAGSTGSVTLTAAQSGDKAHSHGLNNHTHSVGAHAHGNSFSISGNGSHTHSGTTNHGYRTSLALRVMHTFGDNHVNDHHVAGVGGGVYHDESNYEHDVFHTHTFTTGSSTHSHSISGSVSNSSAFNSGKPSTSSANNTATNATQGHSHTYTGTGVTQSHLQPYITCYMFKRTA